VINLNECPTGCGRQHKSGHLMCRPCWSEVPKHLQLEVYRTWRLWSRNPANGEAARAYDAAVEAAVGAIA
jgi:hypothetical protein